MAEPKKVGICAETMGIRKFLREAMKAGGLSSRWLGDLLSQDAENMLEGLSCVVLGGHTEAFLKRIRERIEGYTSIPVILLTDASITDASIKEKSTLQAEWIHLESFEDEKSRSGAEKVLQVKIKAGNVGRREAVNSLPSRCLVGIGSSAGGPKALAAILKNLTESCCGILIVQHIAKGFSQMLAEYLDTVSAMHVKVAEEGEVVRDGTAYLAVHGQQLTVEKKGSLISDAPVIGINASGFLPVGRRAVPILGGFSRGACGGDFADRHGRRWGGRLAGNAERWRIHGGSGSGEQ